MLALRGAIDGIQHLEIGRDGLHDARSWDVVLIVSSRRSTRCGRIRVILNTCR
jgi:hypothetical protein